MIRIVRLLLPALVPSWKFFKTIEPSPRVQWRLLSKTNDVVSDWQESRPRPEKVSLLTLARRLFWNPRWNENLYMVSLAERLSLDPSDHSRDELFGLLQEEAANKALPTRQNSLSHRSG